jgi:hypothetical protein
MTPKRKARLAAQLAALQFGTPQKIARELLLFWFDAEVASPNASVETLAAAVRAAMEASTGTSQQSGRSASDPWIRSSG